MTSVVGSGATQEKKPKQAKLEVVDTAKSPYADFVHRARWIPRAIDLFTPLATIMQLSLLLEQEEEATEDEDESAKAARRKILSNV
ncbi:hypothetical protein BDN67DRAFT_1017848 [Paxillus ammoniavirescens]|nr:hypothetical protein BDN67DRAFT_1017848 [Paxillus ammoniavirescens]